DRFALGNALGVLPDPFSTSAWSPKSASNSIAHREGWTRSCDDVTAQSRCSWHATYLHTFTRLSSRAERLRSHAVPGSPAAGGGVVGDRRPLSRRSRRTTLRMSRHCSGAASATNQVAELAFGRSPLAGSM